MKTILSWSGGKDSTASIILCHEKNIQIDEIIFVEVMYDHSRNISGENPEHIKFIYEVAIPRIERWGYKVTVLRDKEDFLSLFYHKIGNRSKVSSRVGKYSGYFIGGMCLGNDRLKMRPLKNYKKIYGDFIDIVGIAVDEEERLKRLYQKQNKRSVLADFNVTEKQAYELCQKYGLLSSIYQNQYRGGCWFCPNQKIEELATFRKNYPKLWNEFVNLGKSENLISSNFKYGKSIFEVEKEMDFLDNQLTIFDL